MKKNKMLSVAAAMVLTSTAAMAFDTNTTTIQTLSDKADATTVVIGGYTSATPATALMENSADQYGDALIYPAYKAGNGWSTEFTVRNDSSDEAIVAKVVFYSGDKSEEVLDFNIYLSADDMFTWKVEDGVVTTTDGSTAASMSNPLDGTAKDNVTMVKEDGTQTLTFPLTVPAEGYVAVYGMAQATDDNASTKDSAEYHEKHADLWYDYRILLDECRPNWREAWNNDSKTGKFNLVNGMFVKNNDVDFRAPNVLVDNTCGQDSGTKGMFVSVDDHLVGSTRMMKSDDASRELLIPAKAIDNFTDDNTTAGGTEQMVIWADGEFASIADRDINATGSYDEAKVDADADVLRITSANIDFNENKDAEVTLLLTQPFKRTLVQLGDTAKNYVKEDLSKGVYEGYYGHLELVGSAYDLNEQMYSAAGPDDGLIVSPANGTDIESSGFENEVAAIDLYKLDAQEKSGYTEGFVRITTSVPAIVTQMNGGETTGDAQTNWTYAPVK